MTADVMKRSPFPSLALLVLAGAIAIPAWAQQTQPADSSSQSSSASSQQPQNTPPTADQQAALAKANQPPKEGFWGRVNPFARKEWVDRRVQPIKDQLNELDEVNAKNSKDIQDVDGRAQAGIHQAQSTADAAGKTAVAANGQAQKANDTAQQASNHVGQLNDTVNGLDRYHAVNEMDVTFRGGQTILSANAKKQLDDLAAGLEGRQGYIVEIEGHSRGAGSVGIQSSARLTEAVKRYLVIEHQIPVYRLHAVALGNAPVETPGAAAGDEKSQHAKVNSSVHIRLMENSLAAQGEASPHNAASLSGAERP